jgi:hypothetical protein
MVFTVLEERRGCIISGGDHLIERFDRAGFVDIQVIRKNIDIGGWRGGIPSSERADTKTRIQQQ